MGVKIGIRGGYGLYNFGDDALIVALYEYLLFHGVPKEDIYLICHKCDYLNQQLDTPNVIDYNKIPSSFAVEHLVYGGGTQFYSFPINMRSKLKTILVENPLQIFSKIRNQIVLQLQKRYVENKFEIAKHAENVYLVGIGVGPFNGEEQSMENKTAALFSTAKFISVRDSFSYEKCREWNVQECILSPDLCYGMDVSQYHNKRTALKRIGIIVRDWNHTATKNYYISIALFVNQLRKDGYDVKYISLDKKSDKYWKNFFKEHNEEYIQWDADKMTFCEIYNLLSQFDLHVTARFHGAVFASLLHIPFITIGIEQKLSMIARNYEGGAYCWESSFKLEQLRNFVEKIRLEYKQHKENVVRQTDIYQERVQAQYKELINRISSK